MSEQDRVSERPEREPTLDIGNMAEIARWLAGFVLAAIASGVMGNAAYDFLKAWKRRFGSQRVEELEAKVYEALKQVKRKPNVSDRDLRNRVAALFREFEAH